MDSVGIILICLYVVLAIIMYYLIKIHPSDQTVINMLSTFKIGNFVLIDSSSGEELVRVVNQPAEPVPIVKIKNYDNFFSSICKKSELGLCESYIRGEWDCNNLVEFLNTLCLNQSNFKIPNILFQLVCSKSQDNDESNMVHHYNVSEYFYSQFLCDDLNTYSCGFWFKPTDTLNDAQYNKVNTIIKKLNAQPGSSILDIGCGWGKIAQYVSSQTKCKVTGISISNEQEKYANSTYDPEQVIVINMDYRNISGTFDYIYSIGMLEHIRYENYDTFFKVIKNCLKPGGRMVIDTIITYDKSNPVCKAGYNFVAPYIFPEGQIPQSDWIINKARDNGLNIIHFEGFGGQHYARTLKAWRENMWNKKDYIRSKYPKELMLNYDYYFAIYEAGFNTGILGIGHYIITNEPILSLSNSFGYGC